MAEKFFLPDGRTLAYAQYGVPDGKAVFFFHGIPGSRTFRPPDETTTKLGVRLICVDRPGYGESTFYSPRTILDWPKDIVQLAGHLGIDKFSIAGHSGGGPYVAACAYALPERIIAAASVSGAGPIDSPGALEHMDGLNRMGFRVGRYMPWLLWQLAVWAFYREGHRRPETVMERDAATRPRADAELWKVDSIREVCYASVIEAFRHGTKGHAWEARLLSRPWNISLDQIRVPYHLWHGTADRTTPIQMGRYLASKIPNCGLHIYEDEAHLLIFPRWQEILSTLLEHG